jgi:pimeloyl-ACP methyl ester carboxylesterase
MAITLLGLALAIYVGVFFALASMQRSFMYFPQRGEEKELLANASQHKVQPWRDKQGNLIGWKREAPKPAYNRMLILHGNAGYALSRTYLMDGFERQSDGKAWDFYCLEYPGYGSRQGEVNQSSIVAAASEAVSELLTDDARPLFLTGESLGSGVACLLAAKYWDAIRGLFLITPYTSTVDIAASQYPIFPVRLVLQDKYEAAKALKSYSGRVAVLLAGQDEMVPTRFGQALFDGYSGRKQLSIQPNAGHNTLDYDPGAAWWAEVSNFLLQD